MCIVQNCVHCIDCVFRMTAVIACNGARPVIQREIARRYNLTQGTISQHVMTAAIKCMEMYNIRGSDTEIMRLEADAKSRASKSALCA